MPAPTFPMMTVRQVADDLQLTPATVYGYIRSGRLVALQLSARGDYRVRRTDFDAFVTALAEEATARASQAQRAVTAPAQQAAHVVQAVARGASFFERGKRATRAAAA